MKIVPPPFQGHSERIRSTLNGLNPEISQLSNICQKYCSEHEVTSMIRLIRQVKMNLILCSFLTYLLFFNYRTAKTTALEHLSQIETLSACSELNQDYLRIMNSLCKDVLEGFSLMLATSAVTAVLFTLLVLCASHAWIKIKNKNKYHNLNGSNCNTDNLNDYNDETDPFIQPASASSTVSSATNATKRHLRNDFSSRQRYDKPEDEIYDNADNEIRVPKKEENFLELVYFPYQSDPFLV